MKFCEDLFTPYNQGMNRRQLSFCFPILILLGSNPGYSAHEMVTLQSKDGQAFKVELSAAKKSETIKDLIEDSGVEDPIPLPNITGKTLAKIVEFMKYASGHPFDSDRALFIYLSQLLSMRVLTPAVADVVRGFNYLDVRSQREGDVLLAALKIYGDRLFSSIELGNLGRRGKPKSYAQYAERLSFPKDLQKIIVRQSLHSIDRIFLDTSPDRRIHAMESTPLGVAQIIEYIAKNQTKSAADLPESLRGVLEQWQGADFASKIHFGPWPTEFATWPGHCPLGSDPNYNMYSNSTPDDRYIDNGDGTVTDVCTKLTWQQTPSMPAAPLQQAQVRCTKLNTEEVKDWRAPTRIELQSIVNYATANPALNGIFREGNARYWSSTPAFGYENQAWTINFDVGAIEHRKTIENNRMRCVRAERGGPQALGAKNHYTYADPSETVTDNFTGAVWQRRVTDSERNHARAQDYCQSLVLNGTGWSLPSVKASSTLIDVTVGSPRINRDVFPETPLSFFWSSSLLADPPGYAWSVEFEFGEVFFTIVGDGHGQARCVKSRP